eukprot:scaffold84065_cov25-Prasinocladus_malaysianus.AAC.1
MDASCKGARPSVCNWSTMTCVLLVASKAMTVAIADAPWSVAMAGSAPACKRVLPCLQKGPHHSATVKEQGLKPNKVAKLSCHAQSLRLYAQLGLGRGIYARKCA